MNVQDARKSIRINRKPIALARDTKTQMEQMLHRYTIKLASLEHEQFQKNQRLLAKENPKIALI